MREGSPSTVALESLSAFVATLAPAQPVLLVAAAPGFCAPPTPL